MLAALLAAVLLAASAPPSPPPGFDNLPRHVALRDGSLAGDFYAPPDEARHPAILVLGGIEGGIPTGDAQLFAQEGYAALALAYFGAGTLPKTLAAVPLETVTRGLDWLAARPDVDPTRIGIEGSLTGAELALLAAARDPRIRAVAVRSPSAYVWFSPDFSGPERSSWTLQGTPLPYVPTDSTAADALDSVVRSGGTVELRPLYDASLAAAPAVTAARAQIPVDQIAAPVLCLAGDDDRIWDGAGACRLIAARRHEAHRDARDLVAIEPGAGGVFPFGGHGAPGVVPAGQVSLRLGGTLAANAHAGADALTRTLTFFAGTLSRSR